MSNPVTLPPRPANIEQWGREGERFQAGGGQAQPVPAVGPAQPAQPSPFQHRNPAIQVPPFQMQQQQQQLGPRYIYRQSPIFFVYFVWQSFGHGHLVTILVTALNTPLTNELSFSAQYIFFVVSVIVYPPSHWDSLKE